MRFEKYKQNLKKEKCYIVPYDTKVAIIKEDKLYQLGWWSKTTQKHINYAAKELNLSLIKNEENEINL